MLKKCDKESPLPLRARISLLLLGTLPVLLYSALILCVAVWLTPESLREVFPPWKTIDAWVGCLGFFSAITFFLSWDFSKRTSLTPVFWPIVVLIVFVPCGLLALLGTLFPGEYRDPPDGMFIYILMGVMSVIFSAIGFVFWESLGVKKRTNQGIAFFLTGLIVSLILVFPGSIAGLDIIRTREVAARQRYNTKIIQEARSFAGTLCRQVQEIHSFLDNFDSKTFPDGKEAEEKSLASEFPALFYISRRDGKKPIKRDIKVDMKLQGIGRPLPRETPEMGKDLTVRDLASDGALQASATLTMPCSAGWLFDIQYNTKAPENTTGPKPSKDMPTIIAVSKIKTVVRFKVVKEEKIGYYTNGGGDAYQTTVEVEVISLPAQRIVARKLFEGEPPYYGPLHSDMSGFSEAQGKALSWLSSLFGRDVKIEW